MVKAKVKNATDLQEIMASQLDILSKSSVSSDEVFVAKEVTNTIGKLLKLAGLQIAYSAYKKEGGEIIETLENRKKSKN